MDIFNKNEAEKFNNSLCDILNIDIYDKSGYQDYKLDEKKFIKWLTEHDERLIAYNK